MITLIDKIGAVNDTYAIADLKKLAGHKQVSTIDDLFTLPAPWLSPSLVNTDNDAIGQEWYVVDTSSKYKLTNWGNRASIEGWTKVEDFSNYYNKTEVENKITAIPKFKVLPVTELPTSNISYTTLYLVPSTENSTNTEGSTKNIMVEYIRVQGSLISEETEDYWEKLGEIVAEVDLSDYSTTIQIETLIEDSTYTLPIATSTSLGGIKIGDGLSITEGKVNAKISTSNQKGISKPDNNTISITDGILSLELAEDSDINSLFTITNN